MTSESGALVRVVAVGGLITAMVTAVAVWRVLGPAGTPETGVSSLAAAARDVSTPPPAAPRPVAPAPEWIWSTATPQSGERVWFRRTLDFGNGVERVTLTITCDNSAEVFVGDERVGRTADWPKAVVIDLTAAVARAPSSPLIIAAENEGGPAGVVAIIDADLAGGGQHRIVTDATWIAATDPAFATSRSAVSVGTHGDEPWGMIAGLPAPPIDRQITTLPGFAVDLVYRVPGQQGSWVSLAVDDRGRLIASPQSGGLYRIDRLQSPTPRVLPLDTPVGSSQGLLCVEQDLYVMVNEDRGDGPGLYRGRDTNGDDQYDTWQRLRAIRGGGEHGPHAVTLGPDGMIYVVAGNHTPLPEPERFTAPPVWDEDTLLPRLWDARGHAVGIMAPGGWVCRTDRDGRTWEVVATGFRNPYDLAFNADGELFTYDADMEWDMGAPWYRPTRINHVVSGAEFGWRSGSAKWPSSYPDSLPAVVDIGPGSPTGVLFGTGAHFPGRYREALFALDWTFGTIYAVHLTPDGASYRGSFETFITGRPLPVADAVINPTDGAMYFVVGGRGTQSALFRVRSLAGSAPAGATTRDEEAARLRGLRRGFERLHRPAGSGDDVDALWRGLAHDDRFVRFAARVALEHQPLEGWIDRLEVTGGLGPPLEAVMAAARTGDGTHRDRLVGVLLGIDEDTLDRDRRLAWLRAWTLVFARTGAPPPRPRETLRRRLESVYPTSDPEVDRALCELLVFLDSPRVVARTLPLMENPDTEVAPPPDAALLARSASYGNVITQMIAAPPQRQAIHHALTLRHATSGWTPALRDRYFDWFEAMRHASGGLSFPGFLDGIRTEALANMPPSERDRLTARTPDTTPAPERPTPAGPPRLWTTREVVTLAGAGLTGRDWQRGRRMYQAARCAECHRFAGTGRGGVGPDLTAVATRFTVPDLVRALVEPSATISDQYQQTELLLADGTLLVGRIVNETADEITLLPSPFAPEHRVVVVKQDVRDRTPSQLSPMMPGLLNPLGPEELLDLLAYLLAEGDSRSSYFGDS
ncbi:MAG: c-type cytochrome [Phycisphaerales bacterium]|nr:c-type cytochrome [Phycisphaerales bacterium]